MSRCIPTYTSSPDRWTALICCICFVLLVLEVLVTTGQVFLNGTVFPSPASWAMEQLFHQLSAAAWAQDTASLQFRSATVKYFWWLGFGTEAHGKHLYSRLVNNVPLGQVPTALWALAFNEPWHLQDYFLLWLIHFLQGSQCNLHTLLSFPCHFYKDPMGNILSPPLWSLCCISWSLHTCWRLWCLFP